MNILVRFALIISVGVALGFPQTPAIIDQSSSKQIKPPQSASYTLGVGDQFTVSASELDDYYGDKTFRIDMDGNAKVPLVGIIHAGGLTVAQFDAELAEHLKAIVKNPDAAIYISSYGSQPVSVLGAVNAPGIQQLEGEKLLFEVISRAGGLRSDAGNVVRLTRDIVRSGRIPLSGAKDDSSGRFSVATLKVRDIMMASEPTENIEVKAGDVVSVPKADMVYVVGSVTKPGGFLLTENETISTLQVISLAAGLQRTASPTKAKILRAIPGSSERTELAVNVKQLLAGKSADIPLKPNDILFIPNSSRKAVGYRTLDAIVASTNAAIVYGSR